MRAVNCSSHFLKYFYSCFINLLNNTTIILLNLVEYRLILANTAYDSLLLRRLSIRRYSAQFCRIIVNYINYIFFLCNLVNNWKRLIKRMLLLCVTYIGANTWKTTRKTKEINGKYIGHHNFRNEAKLINPYKTLNNAMFFGHWYFFLWWKM